MPDFASLDTFARSFLEAAITCFRQNKAWADKAIGQVADDKLHVALDPNTNSIAVIMKHVAGNLLSRWTDFLTTDGEKPDRNRDGEFVDTFTRRDELLAYWESGWQRALAGLSALTAEDVVKTVTIRGEPHSVPLAVQRNLAHSAYHVGQIIQIARILAGEKWSTITIPRGGSAEFNRRTWGQGPSPSPAPKNPGEPK
jgi:hypothetical protein